MRSPVVSSEQAAASVQWLLDFAAEIGAAKANAERASLIRKAAFALAAVEIKGTVAEREAHAFASPSYSRAVEAESAAIKEAESLKALQAGHKARIDAWQTACANFRSGERGFGSAA